MYKQLSHYEREHIAILKARRVSNAEIGRLLGRDPSTIRRELKRLGSRTEYSPFKAYIDARKKQKIPRTPKKLLNKTPWSLVQSKPYTRIYIPCRVVN